MAIAFVKELGTASASPGGLFGSTNPVSITVPVGGVAAGNRVVVALVTTLDVLMVVSDSKGNSYQYVASQANGGGMLLQVWTAHVTTPLVSGDSITMTPSGGAYQQLCARALEFSGLAATGVVDVSGGKYASNTTDTSKTLNGTTGADRLLLGFLGNEKRCPTPAGATASAGAGFTMFDPPLSVSNSQQSGNGTWYIEQLFSEYRIVNAVGAYTVAFNYNPYGGFEAVGTWDWTLLGLALKGASGGGGGSPPGAPSNLTATAVSTSEIDLAWTDNASDELGFQIERSPDGSSGWTQIAQVEAGVTTYANTGLAASTTYYYRVRAYNAGGTSNYSNTANATTFAGAGGSGVRGACGSPVPICCPSGWYADVADVQDRIPAALWTAGGSSVPALATVETLLQSSSRWIDSTLAWKYVVPITEDCDLIQLRPIVADLVAAQVYEVLAASRPDLLTLAQTLRGRALSALVYHPGGVGSWLSGGSAVIVGKEPALMGRSYLVLPNSTLADTGEAALGQPMSSFTDPNRGGTPRMFSMRRSW